MSSFQLSRILTKRNKVSLTGITFMTMSYLWILQVSNNHSNVYQEQGANNEVDEARSSVHLYVVTPTYSRLEQEAELVRLGQTLQQVPDMTWIVVDDNKIVSRRLKKILARFAKSMDIILLAEAMPPKFRYSENALPRGVAGRNKALAWLRKNADSGVLYFADDDNTYDLKLFNEIRKTLRLSFFPVGLISEYGISSPIVRDGVITGFYDGWDGGRKYRVDMAGFAVNLRTLKLAWARNGSSIKMPLTPGFEEDGFLKLLGIEPRDAEPLAKNCTQILVWHTQTVQNNKGKSNPRDLNGTNIAQLSI